MKTSLLLGRLKLWHKFLLLSTIALVLAAIPTYLYFDESGRSLNTYVAERQGIASASAVLKIVQLAQQHNSLSALALADIAAAQNERVQKESEIDQAFVSVGTIINGIHNQHIDEALAQARQDWD